MGGGLVASNTNMQWAEMVERRRARPGSPLLRKRSTWKAAVKELAPASAVHSHPRLGAHVRRRLWSRSHVRAACKSSEAQAAA